MRDMYNRSIRMIKKLHRVPNQNEWNMLAKKYGLMSYMSLKYVENMNFRDLYRKIKETI